MADDVVFKLTTVYDGTQLAEGMSGSTAVIEEDTASWKAAFDSSFSQMEGTNAALVESIRALTEAIDTIPVHSVRAAEESGSAFDLLSEHIINSAEVAKLEAAGIGGAFSGLGALLGGGIAVGFLAHFLDETNKEVIELGNLATKTGIAIDALAGLQLATRELGVDFSAVQQGLVRLERAQALAVEGGKMQAEAFQRIGLSVKDIRGLNPEDLLNAVSGAMQRSSSSADVAASSFALLGRGGAALIPIFREYGGTLEDNIKRMGEESGVTEEAYTRALQYQKVMADLGDTLRKLGIEAIPIVNDAIKYFEAGIDEARAAVGEIIIKINQWMADLVALDDIGRFEKTWSQAMQTIKDNASLAELQIKQLNEEAGKAVKQDLGIKPGSGFEGTKLAADIKYPRQPILDEPSGLGAPAPKDNRMDDWKLQIQQMEDASNNSHVVMESQELAFWDNILSTVKLKTKEEIEVRHTIATLNKEIMKEMQGDVVRSYEESARAAGEGTTEQIDILKRLADYAVQVYGPVSSEAIRAYAQIATASRKAAEQEMRDIRDVVNERIKANADAAADQQKQLQESEKAHTDQIGLQGAQKTPGRGGSGVIGEAVALNTAREQQAQLIALAQDTESKSIQIALDEESKNLAILQGEQTQAKAMLAAKIIDQQTYAKEVERIAKEAAKVQEDAEKQEDAAHREYLKEREKADEEYAKRQKQLQQEISQQFASSVDMMLLHSKSFHDAIQKLWTEIFQSIVQYIVKMAAQWVTSHLIMIAIEKVFHQASVNPGANAQAMAANVQLATSDAGAAAAVAFEGTMAGIPWPANLAAAPAAGNAALSQGLTFAGFAAAEGGWDVPSSGGPFPTMLHPSEMVLPSDLSEGVRRMSSVSSYQTTNNETNGSPAIGNLHYHAGDVHALDGTGISDVLSRHPDKMARLVNGMVSQGRLDPHSHAFKAR